MTCKLGDKEKNTLNCKLTDLLWVHGLEECLRGELLLYCKVNMQKMNTLF